MKNGFTLIELLIIIVILGVLSVVVIPTVKNSIDEAKDSTYDVQINTITEAAENYFMHINSDINEPTVIYLEDILKSGYLDQEKIINPITEKEFEGCVLITLSSNQYHYKYIDNIDECLKYPNLNE